MITPSVIADYDQRKALSKQILADMTAALDSGDYGDTEVEAVTEMICHIVKSFITHSEGDTFSALLSMGELLTFAVQHMGRGESTTDITTEGTE